MKRNIFKIYALALLSFGAFSCEKDYGDNLGPVEDSIAAIPVTVTNADAFERYPVVNTSVAGGGNITITMEIPASAGAIREISKVATGPFATITLTNLNSTAAITALNSRIVNGTRTVTPIVGNGSNSITFTTTLADYLAYRNSQGTPANFGPAGPPATTGGPGTLPVPSATATPTDIQFYFRLTLEDGSTIVPLPVRVRVQP
ncbi:hypothetical protein [Hymenobacter psychrotolerans]|uniref:DUF1735 domain-containing protein n=1 Tax=Hymenobacter psychrotolerans DSM 18569 TaxID=1121959 RepID=A0A1M6TUY7_9BACT|nr:hypothetical protein [Hymenobacter psychrotolerans]SHK60739.1 hypothetical protein SAMN02746009_01231 [Hymenobacter psychrotolerans DSM 18569]